MLSGNKRDTHSFIRTNKNTSNSSFTLKARKNTMVAVQYLLYC